MVAHVVSVVERIRRAVSCHSGAYFFVLFFARATLDLRLTNGWVCYMGLPLPAGVLLGLDSIDHLGLGGALRRAWAVLWYGIHTWHRCRYVAP